MTAHPRLAAALAAALFTGASFQQLATARPGDYDDAAATLALHDRARYTDGCATHRVPPWARVLLKAAVCFARLAPGRTSICWPARTTAPTCCAWRRQPGSARPSRPPAKTPALPAVSSGTGANARKHSTTTRC